MKQINSCLLFVLFSFFSLLAKAQFDVEKYDKECFLVGLWMNIWGMIAPSKLKARMPFIKELKNIG